MSFFRFLSLFLILLLPACMVGGQNPVPTTYYEQPEKPGGRMCTIQCGNALDHCRQACSFQERSCSNGIQSQAIKDYEAYTVEQFKARQPVELRPRDFEKPEQCAATHCRKRCDNYYNGCFEKCGGTVTTTTSPCQFFCF